MNVLWAPWRSHYIRRAIKQPQKGCLFCRLRRRRSDASTYIVERRRHTYSILNIFPYNNGHLMVVPGVHRADLPGLTTSQLHAMIEHVRDCEELVRKVFHPHAINVGLNLGREAGAGVKDHLHFHIVPRWNGDTNFMPVLGNTKVMSESLKAVWKMYRRHVNAR